MSYLSNITTYQSGISQATAFRIVKRHTANALKAYELTCMQWFTIGTVLDAGPDGIRLSDLAKELDTTLGYMTTTINQLEARNIVTRKDHGTDARTKLIAVTPSYVPTCRKIEADVRSKLRKVLYNKISPEALANYVKVLVDISSLK